MCKRNSQDKNEANTGCKRNTSQIEKKRGKSQPDKNDATTECVRQTPQIKMKPAWDV